VSGSDLTSLIRYKTGSSRRVEIYSYEKKNCVVCKLVNNAESSSELKDYRMWCACSNEEPACQILPSAVLHLRNCMLWCCKGEVNLIIPYIFRSFPPTKIGIFRLHKPLVDYVFGSDFCFLALRVIRNTYGIWTRYTALMLNRVVFIDCSKHHFLFLVHFVT